jgi:hypothetical protein
MESSDNDSGDAAGDQNDFFLSSFPWFLLEYNMTTFMVC